MPEALRNSCDSIVAEEFRILSHSGFDFEFELPFEEFERAAARLQHNERELLLEKAQSFLNESLRSEVCLLHPPPVLAAAALYMSARYLRIELDASIFDDSHPPVGPHQCSEVASTKESVSKSTREPTPTTREPEEVLGKRPAPHSSSDQPFTPLSTKKLKGGSRGAEGSYWWRLFDDELQLDTLVEISTQVLTQLKLAVY